MDRKLRTPRGAVQVDYRFRRDCAVTLCRVTAGRPVRDLLVRFGWLGEHEIGDRREIEDAIGAMLADAAPQAAPRPGTMARVQPSIYRLTTFYLFAEYNFLLRFSVDRPPPRSQVDLFDFFSTPPRPLAKSGGCQTAGGRFSLRC
jgi:hypothetical protein